MQSFILLLFCFCISLISSHVIKTAIVLEDDELKQTHSKFFELLQQREHQIDFITKTTTNVELVKYGVYLYQNLILFASHSKTLNGLQKQDLLDFTQNGGNILVITGLKMSRTLHKYALEAGVEFHRKGTIVMDHLSYEKDDSDDIYHSFIHTTNWLKNPVVINSKLLEKNYQLPVVYNGVGMTIEKDNILNFALLQPSSTAYSGSPVKDIVKLDDFVDSKDTTLVAAVQARNNARLIFTGSVDLFSNKYFDSSKYANSLFIDSITKWVFQEIGVLKVSNIKHHRADGTLPDKMLKDINRPDQPVTLYPDAEVARDSLVYRIKDNLTYSFDIMEYRDQQWIPFKANDVQLEFVMLDPYVRRTMSHNNKGHYSVTFESPDAYGIYQFRIMYRRIGYSVLHFTTQVSLRPYKHNEYERFITSAFPYYASAFSMMFGVFLFSVIFLYGGEK